MARMDRYSDLESHEDEEKKLSRTEKNQRMYDDVYLNASLVDINHLMNENETVEPKNDNIEEKTIYEREIYEEKNYSINDYLEKAHEKKVDDRAVRDLSSSDFQKDEDEISKLIASIEEKEQDTDFFDELRGDNEDTMVKGQMKTDEFNTDIYQTLAEEEIFTNTSITSLEKALGDETVYDMAREHVENLEHTFEKIIESDKKIMKKRKKLPIIVFSISLSLLIIVVVLIIILK